MFAAAIFARIGVRSEPLGRSTSDRTVGSFTLTPRGGRPIKFQAAEDDRSIRRAELSRTVRLVDSQERYEIRTNSGSDAPDDQRNGSAAAATEPDTEAEQPVVEQPVVELRHDAGLTAGHTLGLRPGTFRLGPRKSSEGGLVTGAPEAVSFDLVIGANGNTTLNVGLEAVAVEGVVVDRQVQLEDGDVVQLTTDHFIVRSLAPATRRQPKSTITPPTVPAPSLPPMSGWLSFFALLALFGLVVGFVRSSLFGLLLIGIGGIVTTLIIRSRLHRRARQEHATQLANARSLFFNEILDVRKAAAEPLRSEANTPTTVARMASDPPQTKSTRLYATVASGDRSWTAPVVCHRDPGWNHQEVIDELSFLPAIPFTIDFDEGPVAIVGPRLAALAVARHIATTALIASPADSHVSVKTTVPADWRWLIQSSTSAALTILDGADGPLGPRTVLLAASLEAVQETSPFSHVVHIHDDGRASIRLPNGENGHGFVPHGITETHAIGLQRMATGSDAGIGLHDQQPLANLVRSASDPLDTNRLLVTGPDRSRNKSVLATAALRQAVRYPDRSIFILDRGDRALIRLAQLDACHRYVAIDQIENVEFMVSELEDLESRPSEQPLLLLAPDLWEATAFYRNSGRAGLADRIDQIVDRMELLPMAASAPDLDRVPSSSFLVWVNTAGSDLAEIHVTDPEDSGSIDHQVIDLDTLPGMDLTASVASLATSVNEETPR